MSKKMLINATHTEEVRVAVVDNGKLIVLDVEPVGKEPEKGNIYKGIITRIEPGLEAVFVNYGAERHGFLPFREISREYFAHENFQSRPDVKTEIYEGQEIIVQVDKEQRGTKGAALTTFPSLAGRFIVIMPNKDKDGISRRIDGENRTELKEILSNLRVPAGTGVILRTAGLGRSLEELQWDVDVSASQWDAIIHAANTKKAPFLIHKEGNVVIRAIRDHLLPDIEEILIDNRLIFEEAHAHIKITRPDFINKVKLYNDSSIPLFNRFEIEKQIESAFQREVRLPSGGAIVIDHTEALISIDINSAKATQGTDIENTALQTNLEASEEIARQLRLRDLGGLIVIDYIDMTIQKNQRAVENKLRDALAVDRARVQVGKISRFGLLEMSRQRLRPALSESREITCPRCNGQGTIHSIEALSLIIMRVLEEEAMKEGTEAIKADLPVEVATFLINEKRASIAAVEERQNITIYILPNPNLTTPEYKIEKIAVDEKTGDMDNTPSYKMSSKTEPKSSGNVRANKNFTPSKHHSEPAVRVATAQAPKPSIKKSGTSKRAPGIIKRLWSSIIGEDETNTSQTDIAPTMPKREQSNRPRQQQHRPMHHNKPHSNRNQQNKQPQQRSNNLSNRPPVQAKQTPIPVVIPSPITEQALQQPIQQLSAKSPEDITAKEHYSHNANRRRPRRNNRQDNVNRKRLSKSNDGTEIEIFAQEQPPTTWETNSAVANEQPPIQVIVSKEYNSES
jgi:ribonuclease E